MFVVFHEPIYQYDCRLISLPPPHPFTPGGHAAISVYLPGYNSDNYPNSIHNDTITDQRSKKQRKKERKRGRGKRKRIKKIPLMPGRAEIKIGLCFILCIVTFSCNVSANVVPLSDVSRPYDS